MGNTSTFRPFETHLDLQETNIFLKSALEGAEDGELFLERRRSEILILEDGRIKTASYDASEGFGLRAVRGETSGYAHATDISMSALKRAAETTRLAIAQGGGVMAPPPKATNKKLYTEQDPLLDASFALKVDKLREIDAFVRGLDPRIIQVSASISASMQEIEILRSDGVNLHDARPMVGLSISLIIEQNGKRESGRAANGGRFSLTNLLPDEHWQKTAKEALRIALVNLDAEPAPAGIMDVVLGNGWPGILLHEAVGHGLEGDFNRKKTSVFSGLMGERVAAEGVIVVDDGTLPDRRGSITIDDEGTPSQRNVLIEDGILVGHMQDRQNARLMGVQPTGNGRRESYAHTPMPRMTNTFMLGGDLEPKDIISDVKDGLYAVGFGGGQVDITNGKFVFSCTEAYRVKNGVVGNPVKGATLIGDGATALKNIRAIGNDMALDPGIGTCGKAGQSVPAGVGQPTLLIGGLTVGGRAT